MCQFLLLLLAAALIKLLLQFPPTDGNEFESRDLMQAPPHGAGTLKYD